MSGDGPAVAVVTGGASGIGLATAKAFAAAGTRVVVGDLDVRAARDALGDEALVVATDMTDPAQVERLVAAAVDRFGAIDCFHNNAGIAGDSVPLHELSDTQWSRVIDVNLRGAWLGLRHVLPVMRAQGRGAVVCTASVAGIAGFSGLAAYCASKAGVIALAQVAAVENARHGIRINAIAPGMVATPFTLVTGEPSAPGPFPSGRMGTPEEIAAAVLWLCSDAAAYVNGTCLTVDGGWAATLSPRRDERSRA